MNRILQELREEIECPICLQHMTPPITLCCNGHSICSACKPSLRNCPICRGNLTNNRAIALETIAGKLTQTEEPVPASSAEPGEPAMDFLIENKLKQLQCSMCKEYMIPPIMQCRDCGVFICTYCSPANPHRCRQDQGSTFVQNLAAEALSRAITHRCRFYKSGCMGHFLADAKKQHEVECWFRDVSCPFTIVHPCDWKGSLFNVKEHVNSSHIYHVLGGTSFTANVSQTGQTVFQVVYAMDNFFFHFANCKHTYNYNCRCYDYESCVTCLFIGNEDEAKCFAYTVTPMSQNGQRGYPHRLVCQSYCKFNMNELSKSNCAIFNNSYPKYELNILKN